MSRGMFTGRCYVCGVPCGRTYCNEHRWAAATLGLPDREDVRQPDGMQADALAQALATAERIIVAQERKLDAWRARAAA